MDDRAVEFGHILPLRHIAFGVTVIALAHPEEGGGEPPRFAGVRPGGVDGPEIVSARPSRRGDGVLIADVAAEIVLGDHLAHIFQDLRGGRDRRAGPRLEAITKRVEVAVGTDAGIAVRAPGAAKGLLRFERDEARPRALLGEMIGSAHAGDAGTRDNDIEMFDRGRLRRADLSLNVHLPCLFFIILLLFFYRRSSKPGRRNRDPGASGSQIILLAGSETPAVQTGARPARSSAARRAVAGSACADRAPEAFRA